MHEYPGEDRHNHLSSLENEKFSGFVISFESFMKNSEWIKQSGNIDNSEIDSTKIRDSKTCLCGVIIYVECLNTG
jgi:hypothetical protein